MVWLLMTFHVNPSVLVTMRETPFTDSAALAKINVLAKNIPDIKGMYPSLGGE